MRKAIYVENVEALRRIWPQLCGVGVELLAQDFIPGAEGRIESYHCYVDQRGELAGEFTGRKIRTYPMCYGHTTALEITDAEDVRRNGRAIVERLALTGVAKLDFKRNSRGNLRLLEINPRFNLWHHAGAVAGVNIPALVYADLVGSPTTTTRARQSRRPLVPDVERSPRRARRRDAADSVAAVGVSAAKPSRHCRGTIRCLSCAQHSIAWRAVTSNASRQIVAGAKLRLGPASHPI